MAQEGRDEKGKFIKIGSPEYEQWERDFENTFLGKDVKVERPSLKFADNLPEIKENESCKYGSTIR